MRTVVWAFMLCALCAVEAAGQVRVELTTDAVTTLADSAGTAYGFAVRTAMPALAKSRELIAAYLWIEVDRSNPYNQERAGDRECLAVAGLLAETGNAFASLGRGVPVPAGGNRTVCLDVTDVLREQIRQGREMSGLAIVPCRDEGAREGLAVVKGSAVVGWIDYSFFDRDKRDRLLGK